LFAVDLFVLFVSSWFNFDRLYVSRKLPIYATS
jgi:hypothetical protein